ncbi:MAG: pyridoxamine 5'-phosphate oxidase family protein [Candidatus Pacebacteria bacterium]|nr:pyridoxamine 5'-phosphate oxidase family protein [Candidatus Paceibacterota bacterium]MBP9851351.1 pyridoxamine 5'-phosphate oxidase family protein [Candidatus Paceibacterota bacterium]
MEELIRAASKIIEKIEYLNLATITPDNLPWNTPVYCSYDKELNFYILSWKENQHSKNIRNNSNTFITIYDSTVPSGTGVGVYFQGKAYELTNPIDIIVGLKCHYTRTKHKMKDVAMFLTSYPRRVYKFIPEKVWINGSGEIEGNYIDSRTELDLAELKKVI